MSRNNKQSTFDYISKYANKYDLDNFEKAITIRRKEISELDKLEKYVMKFVSKLPYEEEFELNETDGWDTTNFPASYLRKYGKSFKKRVKKGRFSDISLVRTKTDNHKTYIKKKRHSR